MGQINEVEVYKLAVAHGRFEIVHFRELYSLGLRVNIVAVTACFAVAFLVLKGQLESVYWGLVIAIAVSAYIYASKWSNTLKATVNWSERWFKIASGMEERSNARIEDEDRHIKLYSHPDIRPDALNQTDDNSATTAQFSTFIFRAIYLFFCLLALSKLVLD